MKKILLIACCMLGMTSVANAQETTVARKKFADCTKGMDFRASYNDLENGYDVGVGFGMTLLKYGYVNVNGMLGHTKGASHDQLGLRAGFGVQKRLVFADALLLQAGINPYIGVSHTDPDTDFIYGMEGNLSVGVRLWKMSSGSRGFFTIGYSALAPKFTTAHLLEDHGSWNIGLSIGL